MSRKQCVDKSMLSVEDALIEEYVEQVQAQEQKQLNAFLSRWVCGRDGDVRAGERGIESSNYDPAYVGNVDRYSTSKNLMRKVQNTVSLNAADYEDRKFFYKVPYAIGPKQQAQLAPVLALLEARAITSISLRAAAKLVMSWTILALLFFIFRMEKRWGYHEWRAMISGSKIDTPGIGNHNWAKVFFMAGALCVLDVGETILTLRYHDRKIHKSHKSFIDEVNLLCYKSKSPSRIRNWAPTMLLVFMVLSFAFMLLLFAPHIVLVF